MRVKGEATWILCGPLPLLKTPEALIEECRDQRKLVGLTYQSDSAGSDLQPLPEEPGFEDWWQVHLGRSCSRTARGAELLPQTRHRVPAPSPSALSLLLPVEYWLSLYFKV